MNDVPTKVIEAGTIEIFKIRLDGYTNGKVLEGYRPKGSKWN